MARKRRARKQEEKRPAWVAQRGQEIERRPYLQSKQEGGPDLDPELEEAAPDVLSTFGTERSGPQ